MSINKFHIVFITISSLFMLYFMYWSYTKWQVFADSFYLMYMLIAIVCFIVLVIYSNFFLKKAGNL